MQNFHYISEEDIHQLSLAENEFLLIQIHVSDLKSSHDDRLALLNKSETDKALSFRNEKDRETYACAHAFLRSILAVLFQCKPDDLFFLTEASGKPYVQTSGILTSNKTIHFSLSHSGNYVALCFHLQQPVGIDVEQINRTTDYATIVENYFTEQEKQEYASAENKVVYFLQKWTTKEAAGKVGGDGIAKLKSIQIPDGYKTDSFLNEETVLSVCYPAESLSKNYYII